MLWTTKAIEHFSGVWSKLFSDIYIYKSNIAYITYSSLYDIQQSVIVSKGNSDVNSLPSPQELFPVIFSNETVALSLSCPIFGLKTMLCKTLMVLTKNGEPNESTARNMTVKR